MTRRLARFGAKWFAGLGAWLLMNLAVHAQGPALDARSLGVLEAVLQRCGPEDPASAQKVKEKITQMTQERSAQELARARRAPAYRKGFDETSNFIAMVAEPNLKRACSEDLNEKN